MKSQVEPRLSLQISSNILILFFSIVAGFTALAAALLLQRLITTTTGCTVVGRFGLLEACRQVF
jgi:hypothetical protein